MLFRRYYKKFVIEQRKNSQMKNLIKCNTILQTTN